MRTRKIRTAGILALAALAGAAGAAAQVEDHRQLEFPPLAEFEIPRPEIYELDNGMKVFLMEDHELPLVRVLARIRTGSVWEPAEKTGLASIAGQVQRTGGTRSMTGDEIDDFLEARAASVETRIGDTVGFASLDCLVDDFDEVLPVFYEVLRYPRFAEDKIELAKVQANTGIARRNDDVLSITSREFARLVYGADSPLARMQEYATIAAIEQQDLIDWHGRYYHPNNVYLGVVGDFASDEMKAKLAEVFSDWRRGPEAEPAAVEYRGEPDPGVYFIEKTDVTQANIRLGHLGITVDHPDFFAVQVMNEILGGGFSARLFSRIRSDKGLAYSVGGGVRADFLYPGVAGFGLQTKSQTMGKAVDELFKEVRGMLTEKASAEELARAMDSILNSFIFNYDSKAEVLGQQMLYAYYGLPLDFLETYRQNIEAVTVDDVDRVARAHLHPDEATLLVVGNPADFDRPMTSFGEVTELDITIPPPPDTRPAMERTAGSLAEGGELLGTMVAAMGGEGAGAAAGVLRGGEVVISMGGQTMAVRQVHVLVFPDRMYTRLQTPMGEQVVVIDGGEGFVSAAGQVQPLPAEKVAEELAELGRDLDYLLRFHGAEDLEAVAGAEEEVDGAVCRVVAVTLRGTESRLCVSAEGLVLKQTFRGTHPFTQAPGEFEIVYSDFREVAGRRVPFVRVTKIDGQDFATSTLDAYEVDPEIDPAWFEKPAA